MTAFTAILVALTVNHSPDPLVHDDRNPACGQVQKQWQDYLQYGQPEYYTTMVRHFWTDLRLCKKTLADVGETSKSMLRHETEANCKVRARHEFNKLMNGTDYYRAVSRKLQKQLEVCKLPLEAIGLSSNKLAKIEFANCAVRIGGVPGQVSDYVATLGGITKSVPLPRACRAEYESAYGRAYGKYQVMRARGF